MLLVYVFPNQLLGGIQIHRYTSFYASMAEGFMHQTLNLAIRVRVPMEALYRGSSLVVACKALNLSGGVQFPLPQPIIFYQDGVQRSTN